MQDLIISLNKNVLRISTVDKDASLKTAFIEIPKEIVSDTRILDSSGFSKIIGNLISQVTSLTKNRLSLNFVLEVQDVFLRYVTVSKKEMDVNEQIISEIKEKYPEIPIDETFFSYKKIAPFVYQFIAVKKEVIEKYLDVSNEVGIGLKSVIPWVLALPKYEKVNDPAIFILKADEMQTIALSELNGIFFAEIYEKERSEKEIQSLIKELSFYKRSTPIKHVFTLNCKELKLPGHTVKDIECPKFNEGSEVPSGFEENVIINFLIDTQQDVIGDQTNVLNLLPLPVVETKSSSLIAVSSAIALFVLVGVIYGGYLFLRNRNANESLIAQENTVVEETQVLSEASEQTDEEVTDNQNNEDRNEDPNDTLKKGNLKIRIENGAGVSGLASRTKSFLEEFGYLILSIDTANSTTEATQLIFKDDVDKDYEGLIKNDMGNDFPEVNVKYDLPQNSDYDLLIIVGKSSNL